MPDPRDSGPDPPPAAPTSFVEADVTLDSGPDPPPDGQSDATGNALNAAARVAPQPPAAKTRHTATVRVAVQQPHPFSVQIVSTEQIKIISVDVTIMANGKAVLREPLDVGAGQMSAGQPRTFTLSSDQLKKVRADLKVGNVIQVKVVYDAPATPAQLKLSIIGQQ